MLIRKKKYNNKAYLKDIFIAKTRKKNSLIKLNFFEFFKKFNFFKKNNSYSRIINKVGKSTGFSLYLNTVMFKKYKNLLQKSRIFNNSSNKKLVIDNFKKINTMFGGVNKSLSNADFLLYKNYFLTKKEAYIKRIAFLNKFLKTSGKKKYKPVFYRFFKFTNKKITNNNFKNKNANKKKLNFD